MARVEHASWEASHRWMVVARPGARAAFKFGVRPPCIRWSWLESRREAQAAARSRREASPGASSPRVSMTLEVWTRVAGAASSQRRNTDGFAEASRRRGVRRRPVVEDDPGPVVELVPNGQEVLWRVGGPGRCPRESIRGLGRWYFHLGRSARANGSRGSSPVCPGTAGW
jgi:hypothetical protein